jgi:Divergent InlB B-repeat domain
MAGARQRLAAAATRMRWLPRRFALLLALAFAFLVVAAALGRPDGAAQTEVITIQIAVPKDPGGSPIGAVSADPVDQEGNSPCQTVDILCNLRYPAGTRVTLTALVSNSAYSFHNWTAVECPSGQNVCVLDLTTDNPIVSVFPLYDPAHIDVAVAGPDTTGKVTWPGGQCVEGQVDPCITGPLPAGQPVVFTAEKEGHPINWAFGCEPKPDNPKQCVAYPESRILGVGFDGAQPFPPFEVKAWLQVSKTGSGSGSVTGPEGLNCGNDCRRNLNFARLVTLEADPAAGSRFDGWVGGVCGSNPTCRFAVGPVTSLRARFGEMPPPPPPPSPPPPSPPPPPKLEVRIIKLTSARKAGRWRVIARMAVNKRVSARARVGRQRRTWGDRTVNVGAGTRSLTVPLTRRARRGKCWFRLVVWTAGGERRTLRPRTVKLGR